MYRPLLDGEIVKRDDEFLNYENKWRKVALLIGVRYHSKEHRQVRRKLRTLREKIMEVF